MDAQRKNAAVTIRSKLVDRTFLAAGFIVATAAALPAGPAQAQALPAEWFKVCAEQGPNTICNTQYTLIAETRQLITAVNLIDVSGEVNQRILQAVVPIGRVIPAGVQMQVDQQAAQTLGYSVCFPDRCIAEIELTDAMVASMKGGSTLRVTTTNFERQQNPVNVTLSGFTAAFDGPGQEPDALAARQQQLDQALQGQAEVRRQRFEEAQRQAMDGAEAPAQ